MEEIRTRARLLDPAEASLFTRGLTTLVPRSEVEEVVRHGEFPAPFVLDIARVHSGNEVSAHAQVTVDFDEAELQELLRSASGSDIRLAFDPEELERALDDDVEAHGMRERMAVLAVAAAAAGATAGGALAGGPSAVPDYSGTPATSTQAADTATGGQQNPLSRYVAGVDARTTAQTPSFTSDVASGGTGQPADVAPAPVSDVGSSIGQSPAVTPSFTSDVGSSIGQGEPASVTPSFTSDVAAGGTGEPAASTASFTSDTAAGGSGAGPADALSRYAANVADDANAPDAIARYAANQGSDATSQPAAATPSTGGDSISLPSPAEGAGIAAGLALLITGAGFVAVRGRKQTPGLPA